MTVGLFNHTRTGIFVLIFFTFGLASAFASASFFTVEQYAELHSEQAGVMARFNQRVHGDVQPLDFGRNLRVSAVFPGNQISDYWRRSVLSFKARMDQYKAGYDFFEYFMPPGKGLRLQAATIEKALAEDPDYLIFTLDAKRHQRIIERILVAGRPKVILQNITNPLKKWEGRQPFLYVGFDHTNGTRILARHYIAKTGGKGRYVMLLPKPGYLSQVRGDEFKNYISEHSQLTLSSVYHTGISRKAALAAARQAIGDDPGISFIYAGATDIAFGAMEAVAGAGLGNKIMVNGWGGGNRELAAVKAGRMAFTVMRLNDDNGVAMADAIALDLQGKGKQVPTIFSGDFELVETGVSDHRLQELRKRAFRFSGPGTL